MVIFLHGLNTYGDDKIHVGPLTFGQMHSRIERELRQHGIETRSLNGLGHGSPEQLAERAAPYLANEKDITLLGHSVGGLVARTLANQHPQLDIKRIITFGTPHHGATSAELSQRLVTKSPRFTKLLALAGYDLTQKADTFRHYTVEAMQAFNRKNPASTEEIALLCELPKHELSFPYRAAYARLHPQKEKSDGFIAAESQKRGQVLGPFRLDHFAQMGCFLYLAPEARRLARSEFSKLIRTVALLVSK